MNNTSCMYTVKPLVKLSGKIDFPKCMYSMKNIQMSGSQCQARPLDNPAANHEIVSVSDQKPLPAMKELEIRQEAILKQLTQLKEQVLRLKANLKQPSTVSTQQEHKTAHVVKKSKDTLTQHDIVINASPKRPPYVLLALSHLWQDSLAFTVTWHTHSNVVQVPNDLKEFMQANWIPSAKKDLPHITILIVWKDVGVDTELVVSPLSRIPIRGEVNILRYLSRLGPSQYNYEASGDDVLATEVDAVLDICHCVAWGRTVKEKQMLVRNLNAALGKSQYLTGNTVTLADVAAWSALSADPNILKDVTVNMSKWFQRCSGVFKCNGNSL